MRVLLRSFRWPGNGADIDQFVADCPDCLQAGKNLKTSLPSTRKSTLPDYPHEPGVEIEIDFAGPFVPFRTAQKYMCVIVDRFSRWPEAKFCSGPTANIAITILKTYFLFYNYIKITNISFIVVAPSLSFIAKNT
ncbi:MAG: hypothetical protein AAF705_10040 [Bacteroidota bacterium]